MKKGILAAGIIACILGTGSLGTYAAGQIAQSNSISAETARNFAFVDAGVLPDDVEFERTDFDLERGKFVYDIEFYANGTDYDYTVDASTGMILKRESEVKVQSAANAAASKAAAEQGTTPAQGAKAPAAQTPPKQNAALIGIEKAKEIALADVGKKADDVIFSKAKQEYDNGRLIYDVEFYVNGVSEHEYEIDAVTGAVREKSSEPWEREDALTVQRAAQQTQSGNATATQPAQPAQAAAPAAAPSAPATTPSAPASAPAAPAAPSAPAAAPAAAVSIEAARDIAFADAGKTPGEVILSKATQEMDDGRLVYDFTFFVNGVAEYEYEVDAATGAIREKSHEPWEAEDAYEVQRAAQAAAAYAAGQDLDDDWNDHDDDHDDWDDRYDDHDDWDDHHDDHDDGDDHDDDHDDHDDDDDDDDHDDDDD